MECFTKIVIKWSGKEYEIELAENDTVANLKEAVQRETGVRPERQKLLNLKFKGICIIHKHALESPLSTE